MIVSEASFVEDLRVSGLLVERVGEILNGFGVLPYVHIDIAALY